MTEILRKKGKPMGIEELYKAFIKRRPEAKDMSMDYFKGKICSVKYTFSAQYGTATFNISEDGKTGGTEFICYSVYTFGNQPWVEGNTQVAVGDEVVICGKITNFKAFLTYAENCRPKQQPHE